MFRGIPIVRKLIERFVLPCVRMTSDSGHSSLFAVGYYGCSSAFPLARQVAGHISYLTWINGVLAPLVMYCGSVPFHLLMASSSITPGFWRRASPRKRIASASAWAFVRIASACPAASARNMLASASRCLTSCSRCSVFWFAVTLALMLSITVGGYSGLPTYERLIT